MQFKLHAIHEITAEKIRLYLIDESGKKVPVEFTTVQGGGKNEIVVTSSNSQMEAYWRRTVQAMSPAVPVKDSSCRSVLALGAVASAVGQNALPALVASLSCWPGVSALADEGNMQGEPMEKRAVLQQQFPAVFDLNSLDGSNGFAILGTAANGYLGYSVSSAGDINGDNITDLVLGAVYANMGNGTTYVIFGNRNPFPALFNLTKLDGSNGFAIPGLVADGNVGYSVSSAGDINGDAISDLVLGAVTVNLRAGACYVIFGSLSPFPASFNLTDLNGRNGFSIPGVAVPGQLGYSVSTAGDINGDNIADLVLGAYEVNSFAGACYVIFGSQGQFPASFDLTQLNGGNGFAIPGPTASGALGTAVSTAGDINGDNIADLVLGARYANSKGTSYVVFGSRTPFLASLGSILIRG